MRRLAIITFFASAALLVGLAPVAEADPPVEFSVSGAEFDEVDPCSGEIFDVFLTFDIRLHQHRNNTVVIVNGHAETTHGYVGEGHETVVTNANVFKDVVNFVNTNPETGGKFLTQGRMIVDIRTGEVRVSDFDLRCVRPGG